MTPDAPVAPQAPQPPTPVGMLPTAQPPLQHANEMAIAALILGILGFVWVLPIIGSILAIIFGSIALGQIKQGKGAGRGMAYAGLWLGITSIVLTLLAMVVIIAAIPALQRSTRNTADMDKKAQMDSVVTQLEVYYAEKGYYPAQLSDISSSLSDTAWIYTASPSGCVGTAAAVAANPDAPVCTDYTVAVMLNDGSEYTRKSEVLDSRTIPIPSVTKKQ